MDMRTFINLVEADIDFERSADKVVANLKSYDSQVYTKLAQKVQRMEELEAEIKQLKKEVKADARTYVADLFEAEDVAFTRVVDTVSFIFTLSKNPKATETVQYAKVIAELEKKLTPELIAVLNALKEQYKTVTQKDPSLKISAKESLQESFQDKLKNYFAKFKEFVGKWSKNYDAKLAKLKGQASL